jgi:hypothetical protein
VQKETSASKKPKTLQDEFAENARQIATNRLSLQEEKQLHQENQVLILTYGIHI